MFSARLAPRTLAAEIAERKRLVRNGKIQSITCPTCRFYGWASEMEPVRFGGAWHHPGCPIARARRS